MVGLFRVGNCALPTRREAVVGSIPTKAAAVPHRNRNEKRENMGDLAKRIVTHGLPEQDHRSDLEPRSLADALRVCELVAQAGWYGVRSPAEAFIRIATGKELGLNAMQSLRGIYSMNNGGVVRATLSADLMVALAKRQPDCEYFKLIESDEKIATYKTARKGEGETIFSFTIEQAKQAGLLSKQVWKSYPDAMLRARAASGLARIVYPDILSGLYDADELEPTPTSHVSHVASTIDAEFVPEEVAEPKPTPTMELSSAEFQRLRDMVTGSATPSELAEAKEALGAAKNRMSKPQKVALASLVRQAEERTKDEEEFVESEVEPEAPTQSEEVFDQDGVLLEGEELKINLIQRVNAAMRHSELTPLIKLARESAERGALTKQHETLVRVEAERRRQAINNQQAESHA